MIFIAHRGLTDGPNRLRENTPDQIFEALAMNFVAEIDIWLYQGLWWFGHDEPRYPFHEDIRSRLNKFYGINNRCVLLHVKNAEGFRAINPNKDARNFFWHEDDRFTVTSLGWQIENVNEQEPACRTIINQPELHDFFHDDSHLNVGSCERFLRRYGMYAYGVMTKYPRLFDEAWGRIQNDIK